ncbi:MAG: S9 family peptidase [Opitutaceae bacterium]|nr:S9 family peptidase [Opitutaceae bacterium]
MKIPCTALFCLAVAAFATPQPALRSITHEDVWLMKRMGPPVPSPDGKYAVFSVAEPAYDRKDQGSDLWIVATNRDQPRKLTQTKSPETGVDWSPDSRKIAFAAKREGDEVPQIYVLNVAEGGEAERITNLSTGAGSPSWSPDGQWLLFVSEVYPGAKDEQTNKQAAKAVKDRKYNVRVYEGFPIRHWDHWLDEKKVHVFVQEAKTAARPRDLLAGTKLAALPGFGGKEGETSEELPAIWTPDGQGVVFAATTNRNHAAYLSVTAQLFHVSVAGGEPRQLTSGSDSYDAPRFRPDGKALLCLFETDGDGQTYHHSRLASFPWPFDANQRTMLAAALDLSVVSFAASGDAKTVYFIAEAGTQTKLFSVGATGGSVRSHPGPLTGGLVGIAAGGEVLIANHHSATQPPELVQIDPDRNTYRRLTHFTDDRIAQLDLSPVERFTFISAKGRTIENMIVKPPGFDPAKKYPLFVVMHGGPAPQFKDAWGLRWNYQLLAAPGYVLVLTNYSGSSGYGEAFGQAIELDPLKTPGDEINQGADEAIKRYPFIDATRQAAGGASYGGHLANWLEATTTRYRCIIAHAGLVNLGTQWSTSDVIYHRELNNGGPVWEHNAIWHDQSSVSYAGNHFKGTGWVTPILVTVGEQDFRVPMNNSLENWSYLQRLQLPSKLLVFPEENHWIMKGEDSRFWYGEVQAWLARWLK